MKFYFSISLLLFAYNEINTQNEMENLFKFFLLQPRKIICTSCTNCCFISAPFIFISRTYHLFNFFCSCLFLILSFFLYLMSLTFDAHLFMPLSLLIFYSHLKWKNGIINNFLTQFYVLISIVVLVNAYNSNAYVIFQHPHMNKHTHIRDREFIYHLVRRIQTITWKINGFKLLDEILIRK